VRAASDVILLTNLMEKAKKISSEKSRKSSRLEEGEKGEEALPSGKFSAKKVVVQSSIKLCHVCLYQMRVYVPWCTVSATTASVQHALIFDR